MADRTSSVGQAKIRPFLAAQLDQLKKDLHVSGMKKPSNDDLLSAFVYVASESPVEVGRGVMQAFYRYEAEVEESEDDDSEGAA